MYQDHSFLISYQENPPDVRGEKMTKPSSRSFTRVSCLMQLLRSYILRLTHVLNLYPGWRKPSYPVKGHSHSVNRHFWTVHPIPCHGIWELFVFSPTSVKKVLHFTRWSDLLQGKKPFPIPHADFAEWTSPHTVTMNHWKWIYEYYPTAYKPCLLAFFSLRCTQTFWS